MVMGVGLGLCSIFTMVWYKKPYWLFSWYNMEFLRNSLMQSSCIFQISEYILTHHHVCRTLLTNDLQPSGGLWFSCCFIISIYFILLPSGTIAHQLLTQLLLIIVDSPRLLVIFLFFSCRPLFHLWIRNALSKPQYASYMNHLFLSSSFNI